MIGTNFTYTKDDSGEITDRVLHIVQQAPASNLKALDLTGLNEEDATTIVNAYNVWQTTVKKPHDARVKELNKELKSFDKFLDEEYGIKQSGTRLKAFKTSGLRQV